MKKASAPHHVSFGVPAAERDDSLIECFVSSDVYAKLLDGKTTIILGNRGSGKSALFRMLAEHEKIRKNIVLKLAPEEYSYELLSQTMKKEAQGSWAKHGAYAAAWKYLIQVMIMKEICKGGSSYKRGAEGKIYAYLRDNHFATETNPAGMLISYLKRMEGFKVGAGSYGAGIRVKELKKLYDLEEIAPFIPEIERSLGKNRIIVLVDELDKGWDSSEDAIAFVAGLFQAALSLNNTYQKIRVFISLRRELYDNIPALYEDAQKVRDIIGTVEWDEQMLLELIGRRIIKQCPGIDGEKGYEHAWNSMFAETLHYRQNKSFNYIVDRTLYRPREIIQFCNDIAETAQRQLIPESEKFNYKQIAEAEYGYSEARLKDICSEYRFQYPGLQSVMETFRGGPYNFTRAGIEEHLIKVMIADLPVSKDATPWCQEKDYEYILEVLWRVGFLRAHAVGGVRARRRSGSVYLGSHQIGSLNLSNIQRFQVHPLFRSFLGLKERTEEGEKKAGSEED